MVASHSRSLILIGFALLLVSCAGVPRGKTTVLHEAVNEGDVDDVKELISEVPDVDVRDEVGRTALHYAAITGDIVIAAALLNAGADPDLTDVDGRVPLHYAALSCHADMAAMLLGADADYRIIDDDDESPLDLAVRRSCEEVEQTIRSAM
jgi:ankyrin repeat protein